MMSKMSTFGIFIASNKVCTVHAVDCFQSQVILYGTFLLEWFVPLVRTLSSDMPPIHVYVHIHAYMFVLISLYIDNIHVGASLP